MPGADRADRESGCQIGREHGVDQAVREAGIPDNLPPTGRWDILPDFVDGKADRRLHPAVHGQDPESGDEGTDSDSQCGYEMQFATNLVDAEQHHAEKAGFEEKGGQHFISHKGADNRSGLVRKYRPVGSELIGHDDAGNDAHGEYHGKNLEPVAVQIGVDALVRF